MSNTQRIITIKGLAQLFEQIALAHDMVREFRLGDVWMQETKMDNYPAVIYELIGSSINNSRSHTINEYKIKLYAFDIRREDMSNIVEVMSETHQILSDIYLSLLSSEEIRRMGIKVLNDTQAPIQHLLYEGSQALAGSSIEITLTAPTMLCASEVPIGTISIGNDCISCSSSSPSSSIS